MPFKPMKLRNFQKWIKNHGLELVKAGSGDWKLVDLAGRVVKPFIKVTHPGNEIIPAHVADVEKIIQERGANEH